MSFSSFPDTAHGLPHPTTVWTDAQSSWPTSRPTPAVPKDDMGAMRTVLIDRSIPRHQPAPAPRFESLPRLSPRIVKRNTFHSKNNYASPKIYTLAIEYVARKGPSASRRVILGGDCLRRQQAALSATRRIFPSPRFEQQSGGTAFLNLSDMVGNGAANAILMQEMYRKSRRHRNSTTCVTLRNT